MRDIECVDLHKTHHFLDALERVRHSQRPKAHGKRSPLINTAASCLASAIPEMQPPMHGSVRDATVIFRAVYSGAPIPAYPICFCLLFLANIQ